MRHVLAFRSIPVAEKTMTSRHRAVLKRKKRQWGNEEESPGEVIENACHSISKRN